MSHPDLALPPPLLVPMLLGILDMLLLFLLVVEEGVKVLVHVLVGTVA
jgi:hypothetical protein